MGDEKLYRRVNEGTIARMAGNILSGTYSSDDLEELDGLPEGALVRTEAIVRGAVRLARLVAAEVDRTRPEDESFGSTNLHETGKGLRVGT